MIQYNVEVSAQVYKYTQEGIVPIPFDHAPKHIQVAVSILMQRIATILSNGSMSLALNAEMYDTEDNNDGK